MLSMSPSGRSSIATPDEAGGSKLSELVWWMCAHPKIRRKLSIGFAVRFELGSSPGGLGSFGVAMRWFGCG
jgi:hypothetical protein